MASVKRTVSLVVAASCLCGWFAALPGTQVAASVPASAPSFPSPPPPRVMAQSVVVMDADNGQVLYAKQPHVRRAPASTTKLMTMLLIVKAIEEHRARWNEEVSVTPDAYKVAVEPGVSNAFLDPREHFTLLDMMKFIAVISANDASVAVADKLAGDRHAFAAQMNAEAKALGLTGTHYVNPDGLPAPGHYTTAYDLAVLSRYLVNHYPQVLRFTKMPQLTIPADRLRHTVTWPNTDELLGHYPGLDGLKTGYTDDAGYCFVGTAQRDGRRLIVVVMGDTKTNKDQRFIDTAKLLDYGFHAFHHVQVARAGQPLAQTVPVDNGSRRQLTVDVRDGLSVDLPPGVRGTVDLVAKELQAPVRKGQVVGQLEYVVNGHTVVSAPVVASEDDPKARWITQLFRSLGAWIGHLFHRL
ncbi:MAG: D-alanyl-D-alanine carboxypeptidase [Alicyclobacillaceae bacterium]|nr:D-alanyl-D-alanine carboxypeptidase [Alicyclobacillaceae bacterium]